MGLKVKTLALFFLVVLRFVWSGKAIQTPQTFKRILIFQGGKLGDMICTTPMFRAVKKKYPDCKITVVGSASNKLVLEGNPDVDAYIVHADNSFFDTIQKIREAKADFACLTAPSPISLAMIYLAGVPLIAAPVIVNGWSPFETKSYKAMSNFVVTKEYTMGQYIPREYLRLLEPMGIFTDDTKKYVYWSKEADSKMNAIILGLEKKYTLRIGIMPGAGNKVKQWPAERFAHVADYLIETHHAYVFVIGSESNNEEIETMLSSMNTKDSVRDCRGMSLDETKALISKLTMTVSVDTGPIFIAEACGIPTIDIGGVIHPNDMAPNDGKTHLLITYDGEPLLWSLNSRNYDYKKAREGVESITVSQVLEKIQELLVTIESTKPSPDSRVNFDKPIFLK